MSGEAGLPDPVLLRRALKRVRSPVEFVDRVIGARPTLQQLRVLEALEGGCRRIAVRSGHGVGKSALLAWILLWWLSTRPHAVIPCTAPTAHQLEDVLWGEVARWHRAMREPFRDLLVVGKQAVRHRLAPQSWFAAARTARRESPEALQGFHGRHLAFLIDEASGVPDEVFEVAEGALSTPGALVVMTGNPTRLDGPFHRAFHADAGHWRAFRFPSLDSPLVDPAYAERMAARYGERSDVYRVRVEGEFPSAEPDTLIRLDLVEAARARAGGAADARSGDAADGANPGAPLVLGVDVARFGDDETVILHRRGDAVERVEAFHRLDTMQTAGRVAAAARAGKPAAIFVDVIGVGAGVADRLAEQGFPVYCVNVGRRAADAERFDDWRSELWWRARQWLESGSAALPDDGELAAQLASVKYAVTSGGRIRVESKEDRKKRGLASPDRADALVMTFASPAAALPPEWSRTAAAGGQPFDRELGF